MAQVVHTDGTLRGIVEDLESLTKRLEAVRKGMKGAGLDALPIDGERGQVAGRSAILGFVGNAELALRKARDDLYLGRADPKGKK